MIHMCSMCPQETGASVTTKSNQNSSYFRFFQVFIRFFQYEWGYGNQWRLFAANRPGICSVLFLMYFRATLMEGC